MKHQYMLLTLALGLMFSAVSAAQEAKPLSAEDQLKLTKPGLEHEALARYAGTWDVTVSMGSGASAIQYQGTAESRMTVGGRFLQVEYQAQGKEDETEGMFTVGFDSRHQRYTLIAMDSFGTYFVTSQGPRDAKSGKIRMSGTDDDPVMKALGHTKEFVHVLDLRGPEEFVVEVWFVDTRTAARQEFKYMDYTFRKKK
jgi:hypothetical protein